MTSAGIIPVLFLGSSQSLRSAALTLGGGLVVCGLLFRTEVVWAVAVWNASTAYSHCWFVLPIAAYLAWNRRADAAGVPLCPTLWPALLAIPGSLAWLAAERVGIMEGRQLVVIGFIELLFLAVLGWRLAWTFSAALLYLVFLIPFGAFLTPELQQITAWFVDDGLQVLGIPSFVDRFTIEIPEGSFYIAEACAGLRFLIASLAFGVLYASLMYRSRWRRVAFICASGIIPVIANGLRALGIVVLGHVLGSAEAAAADHLIYGWVFFSCVIVLLTFAGLPFREDGIAPAAADARSAPGGTSSPAPPWLAVTAVASMAALGPATAVWLDQDSGREAAAPAASPTFTAASACTAAASTPGLQRFTCSGVTVTAQTQIFSPRASFAVLVAAQRRAGAEDEATEVTISQIVAAGVEPRVWRLAETQKPARMTATMLWIDGEPGLTGLRARLRQGRNSIRGSDHAPVLMAISVDSSDRSPDRQQPTEARAVILAFLDGQGDLNARAVQLARAAAR